MDDLIKTMKAQLYDRASSPLVFSFICAWAAWNYRLILILLSGIPAPEKIMHVELMPLAWSPISFWKVELSPWYLYWGLQGLLGPLGTALFYLIVLPKFEAKAFRWSQKKAIELSGIKLETENKTPISEEKARELRQAMRDAEKRYDDALESQKAALSKIIAELQADLEGTKYQHAGQIEKSSAEVSALRRERDEAVQLGRDLRTDLDNALANRARLLLLTKPAVDLFLSLGEHRGQVRPVKTLPPSESTLLQPLADAGLVEIRGGSVELTADGQRVYMDSLLPKEGSILGAFTRLASPDPS